MNCPSRTDDTLLHDEWNQNPPRLAPDLTTRQDLNGLANSRESKDEEIGPTGRTGNWNSTYVPRTEESDTGDYLGRAWREVSLTMSGHLAPAKANAHVAPKTNHDYPSYQSIKDWALWLCSVLSVSVLISSTRLGKYFALKQQSFVEQSIETAYTAAVKRSRCADGGVEGDDYNLSLHVAALFIILGTSTVACAFPVLATRFPRLHIPASFLFFVSHFGTGVLIATAFVHLLPTAFTSLGDPCLSDFWTKDYPAMPGAIALAGIFLVTVIEMVFSPAQKTCRGGKPHETRREPPSHHGTHPTNTKKELEDFNQLPPQTSIPAGLEARAHLRDMGPLIGRSTSISRAINRIGEGFEEIVRVAAAPEIQPHYGEGTGSIQLDAENHEHKLDLTPDQKQKKETMQVYLLEMGILFHSVFIGMSLSVSVGNEFVILLIAIVFHQTFEGLALGSRIASLPWAEKQLQPWIMSFAYGCTTPIGQAIGLATHTLYSPDSEVGLLLVGVMNAISAGLLIFASLVELMSEDFLSDESWRVLYGRRRVYACILVFLGAFCMSIVGAWA